MDREEKILKFMNDKDYVPMGAKDMATVLGVPKSEYNNFKEILDKLEEGFKVQTNKKSKYSLLEGNKYIVGTFRGHEKGFGFVKIEGQDEEIYIAPNQTKSALNGDRVLIEIAENNNFESSKKEGTIIKILKREKDTLVGLFKCSRNFGFVMPDDKKFGTDIFISKKDFGGAKDKYKVVVKITKYPENGKSAEGKVIEVLGRINEAGVDMLSLIREYNLPYEFQEDVLEEARDISAEVSKKDIPNRLDLREKEIFTIDGEDAKDLDDAVYVEKTEEGTYSLRS